MTREPRLLSSLRHRNFRWLLGAFIVSDIGSWAYMVALTVWIYDVTGSVAWVSVAAVARFVPALVFGAYAGVLADRFEKVALMRTLDLVFAAVMVAMAVEMALGAPVVLVVATATISACLGMAYDPAAVAMTPHVVPERDLGSANSLRNTVENATVIAGPGLGTLLVLLGPPEVAVLVNALTFLVSAALVSRVSTRSKAVDVTEGGSQGPLAQMTVGLRTIAASPTAAVLVAYSVLATFAYGIDTVLFVAVSDEILGTGPDGYGYLLAGLGVGGIAAAGLVTRLEARGTLGPVILVGMAAYGLPMLLLLVSDSPVLAFVAQVVRGAGTLVVDVLAVTALQRSLPNDVLARVFGAFDSLCLAAILAGSLVTPLVIAATDVDGAIWMAGLGIPLVSLLGWPWLQRMDRESKRRRAELAPRIALLEACDLVADVSDGVLVQMAAASTTLDVAPGQAVVTQGEEADAFYVVMSGSLEVRALDRERHEVALPSLIPGDYFGEIGLIERIPRTASVLAASEVQLLRVDGHAFVDALTTSSPSSTVLDGAALRLGRTHPALSIRQGGVTAEEVT